MLHTDVGIRRGLQGLKLEGPWMLAARVEDSTPCVAWEREVWKTDSGGRWPSFGGWGRAVFRPAENCNCMKGSICGRFWEAGWGSARGLLWVLLCNFDLNRTSKRESLLAEKTLASWSCEKSFRHTDCARVIELPYGYPWYWGRPDHRWVCCVVCLPAGWLHEKGWGWEVDACHLCYANQFKAVCVIYILLCSFFGPKLLSRFNGAMFPVRFLWQFSSVFFYCFLPWHIIQHCGCEISVAFFSPVFMSCSISLWWLWFTDGSLSSGVVYRCYMNTDRKWKCYCKPTSASLLPLHRDCAGRGDSFASSFSICTFFVPPAYSWGGFVVVFWWGVEGVVLELLLVTSGRAVAKQLQSLCYRCIETVLGVVTHLPANSALHFLCPSTWKLFICLFLSGGREGGG